MIYDTLNNLPNYLGLCSSLDSVIEFIMARDINNLPAGRTHIDGDKAVVMVSTVTPQASDKAPFVRHDNHLTLETDLEGSELFEVSLGEFSPTRPADEAADTTVGTADTSIAGMLCEGRFALYLAGEPYKSGLKAQGCGKLKKAVFTMEPHRHPCGMPPPLVGAALRGWAAHPEKQELTVLPMAPLLAGAVCEADWGVIQEGYYYEHIRHRQHHPAAAGSQGPDPGRACRNAFCQRQDHFQVGDRQGSA